MPSKYIPFPSVNIGGFLHVHSRRSIEIAVILPPHPVSVPLKMTKEGIRTAINDYFCRSCEHRAIETEETRSLDPVELSRYCKERGLCAGPKRFGTPKCLAGHTSDNDLFKIANAEYTTPYLGLLCRYGFTSSLNLTRQDFYWKCFEDASLRRFTIYNNFNVYGGSGNTCWGSRGIPKDPFSAYNEFFTSLTNSDLSRLNGCSLKYAIENWKPEDRDWVDTAEGYHKEDILSRCIAREESPITGLLYSTNNNWTESVPDSELVYLPSIGNVFIGWVRKTSTNAQIITTKNLVLTTDSLGSKTKKPNVLCTRKELNI